MNGIHDDNPPTAEQNPRWKQAIPYVLVCNGDTELAVYRRNGREKRLQGRYSLGIGGHIETMDEKPELGQTLLSCAHRELREELGTSPLKLDFLGLINEEQTAAGRVHWGLVFQASVSAKIPHSDDLGPLRWLSPQQAANLPLEHWSHLALSLREKHHKPVTPDKRATTNLSSTRNTECPPCQKKP